MTYLAYRRATTLPAALERYFFVAVLALSSALPFLLGAQPSSLVSAEEMGILSDQGDATKQMILALLYAGCGAFLLWRTRLPMLLELGAPLLFLLLWCFASALWCDLPSLALRRSAALSGTLVVGLYAGLRFDVKDLVRLLCRVVGIVVLASLVVAAVVPSMGLDPEGRLRGVFAHKNFLGSFAALGLLTLVARLVEPPSRRAMVLDSLSAAGCVLCLVLARSASPLPTIGFALLVLFWVRRSRAMSHWPVGMVLAAACTAGFALPLFANDLGSLATVLGRDAGFSGRTMVWEFGVDLFTRNPWLGYGYGAFWNGPAGTLFLQWARFAVPHAHNGYLQLALDSGSIGLVLFLCAVAVLVFRAVRLLDDGEQSRMAWPLAFIAFYLVSNLAESRLWIGNELLTMLLVYVVVRTNVLSRSRRMLAVPTHRPGAPIPVRGVPCFNRTHMIHSAIRAME